MFIQTPDQLPTFCDAHEVATFFKVKRRTVYAWVDSGRLPALRLHGRLRFERAALIPLLQTTSNTAAVKP